jgi:Protein of unknown function (DUF3592)
MDPNSLIALIGGTVGFTIFIAICTGAFSLLIMAAVIGGIVLLIRGGQRRRAELQSQAAAAAPATATIVKSESFSSENNSRLVVNLTLDINPQYGPAYRTETHWAVDYIAASNLQPGMSVPVRVNPAQPGLVYPGVPWAEYTDQRVYRLS